MSTKPQVTAEDSSPHWGGFAASGLLGVVAALPWLHGFSYSRGYDLFLWIYNAWYLKMQLLSGSLPNWSNYSSSGQPYFKIAGLVDAAVLAALMEFWGVFAGVQVFVLLLYLVAALGLYRLAITLLGCHLSAWIATAAYTLSWFLTFTVYFQAYLSNMLVYAVIPWFVFYARRALASREAMPTWAASLILTIAALTNPQVAIKMVCVGLAITLPLWRHDQWRSWLGIWGCIVTIALACSLFDIISALRLRTEVLTINTRANSYVGPFTLVGIPAFVLGLLTELVTSARWPQMQLWELLYSEYPGTCVVLLAVLALVFYRGQLVVKYLWLVTGIGYTLFFFVLPQLPASPWLGSSHNILIIPVISLALLSGFGALGLRRRLAVKHGKKQAYRTVCVLAALLFIELYGLLVGLRIWGTSGIAPTDLPEVKLWNKIAAAMQRQHKEPRFFSLNPDWTIGLFPVFTSLPTANVIELRQRSPDYQSYLDLVSHCSRLANCGASPSALLAPLNVAFLDVPRKFFTYEAPNKTPAKSDGYTVGITAFDHDPHLRRFATRTMEAADLSPHAATPDWSPLQSGALYSAKRGELAQVIYENTRRYCAFVAERTVAIVGSRTARQKIFANIIALTNYDPSRVLFLLLDDLNALGTSQQEALDGYISLQGQSQPSPAAPINLEQLESWYDAPKDRDLPVIEHWERSGVESLKIRLDRSLGKNRFLFVSQQRFRDWHGRYADGESTPVFRATAGLTAVFVEAGKRQVTLTYVRPQIEIWSSWISLAALLGTTIAACSSRALTTSLRKRVGF